MLIEVTSNRYDKLFGHHPFATQSFESDAMPYETMVACLSDPSLSAESLGKLLDGPLQHAIGTRDFKLGTQYMLHTLVTYAKDTVLPSKLATTGLLGNLSGAVDLVMQRFSLPARMTEDMVEKALMDAAFSGGMQALGALGPVGKVVAAVVGFAVAIGQTYVARKEAEKKGAEQARRLVHARMPPLQQPSTFTDDFLVSSSLLPALARGDWTPIFSPRFESNSGDWVGIKRKQGYAFAPGSRTGGVDAVGDPVDVFEPGEGLGIVPGRDMLTSVLQVSLDTEGPEMRRWQANKSLAWPVAYEHVVDVGQFYVNTARLGAVAWATATQQDQSLDLYKLYVGTPGGPGTRHLHARWKKYCDGGLRFLTENAKAWADGKLDRFDDLRHVYGASIGCAVGAWQCYLAGGTTGHPQYGRLTGGNLRGDMGNFDGLSPVQRCVMHPNLSRAMAGGKLCLVTMYDSHIRPTLEAVRARQDHYLRRSLACAYVRSSWGAFQEDKLQDLLGRMRALLLEHPDRMLVDLDDVPDGEMFEGQDWKGLLQKRGVRPRPPALLGVKLRPGTLEQDSTPAPMVPESAEPMAFGRLAATCSRGCEPRPSALRAAGVLGGAAVTTGLGYWLLQRSRARRTAAQ